MDYLILDTPTQAYTASTHATTTLYFPSHISTSAYGAMYVMIGLKVGDTVELDSPFFIIDTTNTTEIEQAIRESVTITENDPSVEYNGVTYYGVYIGFKETTISGCYSTYLRIRRESEVVDSVRVECTVEGINDFYVAELSNHGFDIPPTITRAISGSILQSDYPDFVALNKFMRYVTLNSFDILGKRGSVISALTALTSFGYDNLTLYSSYLSNKAESLNTQYTIISPLSNRLTPRLKLLHDACKKTYELQLISTPSTSSPRYEMPLRTALVAHYMKDYFLPIHTTIEHNFTSYPNPDTFQLSACVGSCDFPEASDDDVLFVDIKGLPDSCTVITPHEIVGIREYHSLYVSEYMIDSDTSGTCPEIYTGGVFEVPVCRRTGGKIIRQQDGVETSYTPHPNGNGLYIATIPITSDSADIYIKGSSTPIHITTTYSPYITLSVTQGEECDDDGYEFDATRFIYTGTSNDTEVQYSSQDLTSTQQDLTHPHRLNKISDPRHIPQTTTVYVTPMVYEHNNQLVAFVSSDPQWKIVTQCLDGLEFPTKQQQLMLCPKSPQIITPQDITITYSAPELKQDKSITLTYYACEQNQ